VNPRSEPLIWVQLIGLGALPLEVLLLLLLLAGGDPGPLPQLEHLLTWGLGAAAPAVWLWRHPADPRSLLLIKAALAEPTAQQRQLAALQIQLVPRMLFAIGVAGLLPLLSWLDGRAALASNFSPVQDGARLSSLLLAALVLAVLVWQWQQLVQCVWLVSRSPSQLASNPIDASAAAFEDERSSPGLPLLLLGPLVLEAPPSSEPVALGSPVAVEPEQPPKETESPELDQEID